MKPLVFDLFCGLGGWSEAFIAEGYRAVGFDIEAHDYGNGGYPGELVLRDVRSLSGAELVKTYGVPALIVASPPCQEFSYMAMPWSKAKEKLRKIAADPAEQKRLTDLFNQCFRIQRELSAAAGHYVPMVVENVRGAQRWVGRSRWNFGSFHLWGDVPALMPNEVKFKSSGMNWCDQTKRGQDFTRIAHKQLAEGQKHGVSCAPRLFRDREHSVSLHNEGTKLQGNNGPRRWEDPQVKRMGDAGKSMNIHMTHAELKEAVGAKPVAALFGTHCQSSISRMCSSKSPRRKQASAEISKIPRTLATWMAKCFKP